MGFLRNKNGGADRRLSADHSIERCPLYAVYDIHLVPEFSRPDFHRSALLAGGSLFDRQRALRSSICAHVASILRAFKRQSMFSASIGGYRKGCCLSSAYHQRLRVDGPSAVGGIGGRVGLGWVGGGTGGCGEGNGSGSEGIGPGSGFGFGNGLGKLLMSSFQYHASRDLQPHHQ